MHSATYLRFLILNKASLAGLYPLTKILLLITYLSLNIENVGNMGTGLVFLAGFVALSLIPLFLALLKNRLTIAFHFFVFLLFIAWLSFRVVVDLGSLEELKQITVATTGGVLLFFLIGTFARQTMNVPKENFSFDKFFILTCLIAIVLIFLSYKSRLLEHTDIFYISDVEGSYQRPGNFMIMLFFMTSYSFLVLASNFKIRGKISYLFWLAAYALTAGLLVIDSQMIGSNAATANVLAVFMMTFVISLLAFSKNTKKNYVDAKLCFPLSKKVFKGLIKYSIFSLFIVITLSICALSLTGFDVSKTRAFGFGNSENLSVNSRVEILKETGADQIGYAPILGNTDVAYLTTGNAGKTLHNFLPNIWAELGLVGLVIVLSLFYLVFKKILTNIKSAEKNPEGYQKTITNFWLVLNFLWLFLYANISVGKEWPVMWFFVGFAVNAFITKPNRYKNIKHGIQKTS